MHNCVLRFENVTRAARRTLAQSQRIGAEFLLTEVNVALTFLDVAGQVSDAGVRIRNYENARAAYDTIQHFLPTVTLSEEQRPELANKLGSLRTQLIATGYSLAEPPVRQPQSTSPQAAHEPPNT